MIYAGRCHNGPLDGKDLAHRQQRYWLEQYKLGTLGHYFHIGSSWVWVPYGDNEPDIAR